MGWKTPTTYLQRLGDALELLCAGHRPPDEMMTAWLDTDRDDMRLQSFACEHGPSWAQGIGVIDAARTLADEPTEILFIDGPQIDHERLTQPEDHWKTRCMTFATALVDVMGGTQDHDIQADTGLSQEDCARIAAARSDARTCLYNAEVSGASLEGEASRSTALLGGKD